MSMTSEGVRPKRTAPKHTAPPPLWDQCDTLHLRGALVALNSLLSKLPETKRLNKAGLRVCDKACDARNALRMLLAEHDAGDITLDAMESGVAK